MTLPAQTVIEAIEAAPYNMGVKGSDWLAYEGNIALAFEDGGVVLFDHEDRDTYHTHFLLTARGRAAINQVRDAFRTMFEQHGAELIFGLIPDHRRDVKLVARWAGAKSAGKRETVNGVCELFVISNLMFFKRAN